MSVRCRATPAVCVEDDAQSPKGILVDLTQGGRAQKLKLVSEAPYISIRGEEAVPQEGSLLLFARRMPFLPPLPEEEDKEAPPSEEARVKYEKYTKTILEAGKADKLYGKVLGQVLEIVLLDSPRAPQKADRIRYRVLFRGEPLADARVRVFCNRPETLFPDATRFLAPQGLPPWWGMAMPLPDVSWRVDTLGDVLEKAHRAWESIQPEYAIVAVKEKDALPSALTPFVRKWELPPVVPQENTQEEIALQHSLGLEEEIQWLADNLEDFRHALLSAEFPLFSEIPVSARTDAKGEGEVNISGPGLWVLQTEHGFMNEGKPPEERYVWASYAFTQD